MHDKKFMKSQKSNKSFFFGETWLYMSLKHLSEQNLHSNLISTITHLTFYHCLCLNFFIIYLYKIKTTALEFFLLGYFLEAALINAKKDSSGYPGLLLNSGWNCTPR